MSTQTWSHEVESSIDPARMFKASMLDWHNLGPKIMPEIIVSSTVVAGDGNPIVGSIRQLNFTSARTFTYVKERLDFVDLEKFECKSSLVEGGLLGVKLESLSFHYKFEAAGNGGCVVKLAVTFKTLAGAVSGGEADITKDGVTKMIKATDAYLVANPTAYV